jgi:exodeoxyribonuclease VII small subunit
VSDSADIGYAAAIGELDSILRELESDNVDVDRLVDRVARAQFLITLCRDRLGEAQMRVRDILGDGDDPKNGDPGT